LVNFIVNIQSPATTATLTGITPGNLPSGAVGETFAVTLYGSRFVASASALQATFVGVVPSNGGNFQKDPNIVATVNSATSISLAITVPAANTDSLLPFTTAGSTVTLGVCNPNGAAGNPPCVLQSQISFTIDNGPIIAANGVTSASTFLPANLAPYDIVSIFGSNFCVSGGTGCAGVLTSQVVGEVYQYFVTPDVPNSTGERFLQVFFCKSNATAATLIQSTSCFAAPLLFATNSQINAIVPGEALSGTSTVWDVYVRFGLAVTPTTTLGSAGVSPAYAYTAATIDPGVFIVDSNNFGAIVSNSGPMAGYVTNSATQAARLRQSPGTSDVIDIYMTGLGTPGTTQASCMTVANYATAASLTTSNGFLDGAILDPSNYTSTSMTAPCFAPSGTTPAPPVTFTVGGQNATALYIGWASDSVAGLYQIDLQLPAMSTSQASQLSDGNASPTYVTPTGPAVQVPVVVTSSLGASSQLIYMYAQPAMTLSNSNTPGDSVSLAAMLSSGYPYNFDTVTAANNSGSGPTYTLTADSLEGNSPTTTYFTVGSTTGAVNIVKAIPRGTYTVTIKAADTGGTLPDEYITLTITVGA